MSSDLEGAATAVQQALADAERGLVDRRVLVELVALAAVAGEHLLVLGPPGTAKSEAVRRVARAYRWAFRGSTSPTCAPSAWSPRSSSTAPPAPACASATSTSPAPTIAAACSASTGHLRRNLRVRA